MKVATTQPVSEELVHISEELVRVSKEPVHVSKEPVHDEHPLSDRLGYALRRAQAAVFQDFCESTASSDLRPAEYSVLVILREMNDVRHNRLARILGIKPANCATLINKLEKRSLVTREKLRVSGRAVLLRLTEEGDSLLQEATTQVDAHRQRLRDRIGDEGAAQLLQLLNQLYRG